MSKFKKISFLTCTLIVFSYGLVNAKSNRAYIVDSSIVQKVEKKVRLVDGGMWVTIDFRVYQEDSLIYDTHANGKSSKALAVTGFQGDTVRIVVPELFAGFDYEIILSKDTGIVKYSVFSSQVAVRYKLHENDGLQTRLAVPVKNYTLRLSKKPAFSKGEVFDGIIELTSEDYYRVRDGEQSRYRMELTSYFRKPEVDKFMEASK
jgi:hypothetical protein